MKFGGLLLRLLLLFLVIKLCNRPFSSLDEMNETLIENWNKRVTNLDKVYILGDLMFRSKMEPNTVLSRLKGKKHLIVGNHDHPWMKKVSLGQHFESVDNLMVLENGKSKITLCHFPMMSFEGKYLIYGHIHNNKPQSYWPLLKTMENAFNSSVEVNDYKPVSFEELIENNAIFRAEL